MDVITYALQDIETIAGRLLPKLLDHKVIALHGDLGAGKTSFAAALGKCLDMEDQVSSPTFSIINEYHLRRASGTGGKVFHMDWYRLAGESEAEEAGVEAVLQDPDAALVLIEWPERASRLLPPKTLHLHFSPGETPERRELRIKDASG